MKLVLFIALVTYSVVGQAGTRVLMLPSDAGNATVVSLVKEKTFTGRSQSVPCFSSDEDCVRGFRKLDIYESSLVLTVSYDSYSEARNDLEGSFPLNPQIKRRLIFPLSSVNPVDLNDYDLDPNIRRPGKANKAWAQRLFAVEIKEKEVVSKGVYHTHVHSCPESDAGFQGLFPCSEDARHKNVFEKARFLFIRTAP